MPPLHRRLVPALAAVSALACTGKTDSAAPADTAADLPTEGELRILTYNVAGLPDGISGAGQPLLERMPQIAARLDDYDLVGMQEDFDATGHAALVDPASHETRTWFDTLVATDRAYGSGLSQLARAGQVAYAEEHYDGCHGVFDSASDCLASKGFQTLTLSLGGQEVDFINTHHEAGGGDEDIAVRMSQVEQVVASADGRSAGRAIIFLGDFNLRYSDTEDLPHLARYDEAGLLRVCDLLSCPEPDHIDQVRLRSSDALELEPVAWARVADMVDAEGEDLSDHPAIEVTVRWRVR